MDAADTGALVREAHRLLRDRGETVALAESLTGGLLGAALTGAPGASDVFRGGVVAYATELKARLLAVDARLLAARGAVDADVARAMAEGARDRLGATYGLAATGVAGPDAQDGLPPGTVHLWLAGPAGGPRAAVGRRLALAGDREAVRDGTVLAALRLLTEQLGDDAEKRV